MSRHVNIYVVQVMGKDGNCSMVFKTKKQAHAYIDDVKNHPEKYPGIEQLLCQEPDVYLYPVTKEGIMRAFSDGSDHVYQ